MTERVQTTQRKSRVYLRKGEQQRPIGTFAFRWSSEDGKRHAVYAETLEELRAKEQEITKDQCDRIKTEARYCNVHSPKTKTGIRHIPMLAFVKEAFQQEKQYQKVNGICCNAVVDGYTDFIFVNRFGQPQHQGTLNKALRRIIRDCNDEELMRCDKKSVLLPPFSCHTLCHTFTTRMCEAGVNIKVIQDTLGHADVSTTLNIYADVTKDLKRSEFSNFETAWQAKKEC